MSILRLFRGFATRPPQFSPVQSEETFWQKYRRQLRQHPVPIWAGLLVVGFLQYRRIQRRDQELERSGSDPPYTSSSAVAIYESLPLAAVSRVIGVAAEVELPAWARRSIFSWYSKRFGCNLEEAVLEDVTSYPRMCDFFTRRLKDDAREIDSKAPLTSPCDGKVLSYGMIDEYGYLEQIKGMNYPLRDFIGPYLPSDDEKLKLKNNLYHITIYLAPGDYHHFHSPTDWKVNLRRHFSGKLLSVGKWASQLVPRLFVQNERVVYTGRWPNGFFSMTAVGATNVGSILIDFDADLKTNCRKRFDCKELAFNEAVTVKKGQHFGLFNLGSTIVLVFEAPENFRFNVHPDQRLLMGQAIGYIETNRK